MVFYPVYNLYFVTDGASLHFSCGSFRVLCIREDMSELELVARKFELEGNILKEINQQAKSDYDLYPYPLSNTFQSGEEEDGYSPYCEIKFEFNPGTTGFHPYQQEPISSAPTSHIRTPSSSTHLSESSTCTESTHQSSVEQLKGSRTGDNVRYNLLIFMAAFDTIICVLVSRKDSFLPPE